MLLESLNIPLTIWLISLHPAILPWQKPLAALCSSWKYPPVPFHQVKAQNQENICKSQIKLAMFSLHFGKLKQMREAQLQVVRIRKQKPRYRDLRDTEDRSNHVLETDRQTETVRRTDGRTDRCKKKNKRQGKRTCMPLKSFCYYTRMRVIAFKNISKIFKIQKGALRITSNSPYLSHNQPLFERYNALDINNMYKKALCLFMYKYHNGLLPNSFDSLFTNLGNSHSYNTRNTINFRVKIHKVKSVITAGRKLWNSLPKEITKCKGIKQFKNRICDPSQQNRAIVCYQEKCDIPFIWKSILLTQRWYHSCVNWMQHCNFMVKNKS